MDNNRYEIFMLGCLYFNGVDRCVWNNCILYKMIIVKNGEISDLRKCVMWELDVIWGVRYLFIYLFFKMEIWLRFEGWILD